MEVLAEAKVYMVNMQCDKCGKGIMQDISGNVTLCTYPPQYPRKCDNCGHTENYNQKHPYPKVIAEKGTKLQKE